MVVHSFISQNKKSMHNIKDDKSKTIRFKIRFVIEKSDPWKKLVPLRVCVCVYDIIYTSSSQSAVPRPAA